MIHSFFFQGASPKPFGFDRSSWKHNSNWDASYAANLHLVHIFRERLPFKAALHNTQNTSNKEKIKVVVSILCWRGEKSVRGNSDHTHFIHKAWLVVSAK